MISRGRMKKPQVKYGLSTFSQEDGILWMLRKGESDISVRVTGKYAFSFTTYVFAHECLRYEITVSRFPEC